MNAFEKLFWILIVFGLYPYVGYPLIARAIAAVCRRGIRTYASNLPSVSIVVAAHNESKCIDATLRNKLSQNYPADLIEIIVVSDESNDGTDDIVSKLAHQYGRVHLIRQEPRRGKSAALNLAMERASGDLVVFSDANSIYQDDAVRRLVASFADPAVGYVTGCMLYVDPGGTLIGDGCTAYMKYENWLRRVETRLGSIVGVDGAIDCMRRRLYRPLRPDQLPDFALALDVVEQGYRAVYEPMAVVTEESLTAESAEYKMRVRVALRGLWAIWDKRALLSPMRFPLYSWQLASHKLFRYLSPVPLAAAAIVNWFLLPHGVVYRVLATLQIAFLLLVASRIAALPKVSEWPIARYSYYFVLLNVASAVAVAKFARGIKTVTWQPRTG